MKNVLSQKIIWLFVACVLVLYSHTAYATNPQFTSVPENCVITGNDFSYPITVEDADLDYVDITTDHLPSFLQLHTTQTVSTVVGGQSGFANGSFSEAQITHPGSIIFDKNYDIGYLVDYDNHMIRLLDFTTEQISTYIGSAGPGYQDGPVASAQVYYPSSMTTDGNGNIYLTEHRGHRIRKIDTINGTVSTIAGNGTVGDVDGIGINVRLRNPVDIVMGENTDTLYFVDAYNHKVKKVDLTNNHVTTIAGSTQGFADGTGASAQFLYPYGIEIDPAKEHLYIADGYNHRIRRLRLADNAVTTIAGNGTGAAARFDFPYDVEFYPDGSLYITDYNNNLVRKMDVDTREVTTILGSTSGFQDGNANQALFHNPTHLKITSDGDVYVSDRTNVALRKIDTQYFITGTNLNNTGEFPFSVIATDVHSESAEQDIHLRIGDGIFLSDMEDIYREISSNEDAVTVTWDEPSVQNFCGNVITDAIVTSNHNSGNNFSVGHTHVIYDAHKGTYADQKNFNVYVSRTSEDDVEIHRPRGITLTCSSQDHTAFIAWDDNSKGEDIYQIQRKIDDEQWRTIKRITTRNRKNYTDTDVEDGHIYSYRVRIFADDTHTKWSENVSCVLSGNDAKKSVVATVLSKAQNSITKKQKKHEVHEEKDDIQAPQSLNAASHEEICTQWHWIIWCICIAITLVVTASFTSPLTLITAIIVIIVWYIFDTCHHAVWVPIFTFVATIIGRVIVFFEKSENK
ncbi:MAG: hypothetical protein CR972_00175 [Candidatus Moraniibacteriota bacterium]|nr:MAG: hypothetical protein CR972_00175 [Candidatus Moranbacteria bacterium]